MTNVKLHKDEIKWSDINWKIVEREVYKLQKRIYRASQDGDVKRVHKLQKLLTKSYYGRLLAVRKVTQDNQGKRTAGVDGVKTLNPQQRLNLTKELKIGKRKVKPTRRVWIPKANGEKRGLGIPVMFERALQALAKIAIEPQWEAKFEPNSYGFRPARGCHDAVEAILKAITRVPKYVLDADIAQCFDKIDHQKLLDKMETYPSMRKQVKNWLKSGVMDGQSWYPTEEGTPQGGVISPLLANIALHGMEEVVRKFVKHNYKKDGWSTHYIQKTVSLIRYADDFVILHENLDILLRCKEIIERWLSDIGLKLKPEKTKISHTLHEHEGNIGFDFLGFNIRQYPSGKNHSGKNGKGELIGHKTLIEPSKEKIKNHLKEIGDMIRKMRSASQEKLIGALNPIIRGWCNYYSTVCSKKTFSKCSHVLYQQLRRWAFRKHPNKNRSWIVKKYWHTEDNNNWVFKTEKIKLVNHQETSIRRHTKVKGESSIYDGNLIYWSKRMGKHPEMPKTKAVLINTQKGKCNICGLHFKEGDKLEIDHIVPKSKGGKNEYKNLQLLHKHCHDYKTATDGSLENISINEIPLQQLQLIAENLYIDRIREGDGKLSVWELQVLIKAGLLKTCTHDKGFIKEERNEVKVSRSVLKTSGSGDISA